MVYVNYEGPDKFELGIIRPDGSVELTVGNNIYTIGKAETSNCNPVSYTHKFTTQYKTVATTTVRYTTSAVTVPTTVSNGTTSWMTMAMVKSQSSSLSKFQSLFQGLRTPCVP